MLEKEASEQANKKYPIPRVYNELDVARNRKYEEGFKDGAEFGYNKANEWYYPSKGEYPDDKTEMLIYFKYTDCEYPCKTFGFYNGKFWETKRGDVSNKELIAWKEIIMPKER